MSKNGKLHDFLSASSIITLHLIQIFGYLISIYFFLYILFTSYWWLLIIYLFWMYVIDADTPNKDLRALDLLKNSKFAKYLVDYYPVTITKSEEHELDPKKNYLFVPVPHGIWSIATYFVFGTIFDTTRKLYPDHVSQSTGLSIFYKIPFYREIILWLGARSCAAEALIYALTKPSGGNILSLVVGGAEEAFYSWPGTYKTIIKRRKGFIKIVLKTGASLVPVIPFGINDDFYYQIQHPYLRVVQNWLKKLTNVAPVMGCGRFYLPFFPRRVPITFVG